MSGEKNTLTEIMRQGKSIDAVNRNIPKINEVLEKVFDKENNYDEIICIGCGTSLYIAQSVAAAVSSYARIASRAVPCSEIFYYPETFAWDGRKILVIPFTRNSQTTEVKKAINKIRTFSGVTTLSITCDSASSDYNDYMILSPDAAEKSVVMTSSYTSMLYLGIITALYASEKIQYVSIVAEEVHSQMDSAIRDFDDLVKRIVNSNLNFDLFIVLGQGVYYGVANECMNKIKEMAIANTEAYYTLEYRHGPMSIVDVNTFILIFSTTKTKREDEIFINEMRAYGATVMCVYVNCEPSGVADYEYDIRNGLDEILNTIPSSVVGQLIGYYKACSKGINADSPRHLSQAIILEE